VAESLCTVSHRLTLGPSLLSASRFIYTLFIFTKEFKPVSYSPESTVYTVAALPARALNTQTALSRESLQSVS